MVTGPVNVAAFITPGGLSDKNRRTRIASEVDTELRGWLRRAAQAHSHIATIVRLFGNPEKAGGQSLLGEGYAARVARGDRTVLFECVTYVRDELDVLRGEIQKRMDAAPPTHHEPGSRGKVEVMAQRLFNGESLFIERDAKCKPPI